MKNIISVFPKRLREHCEKIDFAGITDIRISAGAPLIFMGISKELETNEILTPEDVETIVGNATENSLYSFMDNIREGFITLKGGHRMGIAGMAVNEKGRLSSLKDICYINIRISREIKGLASGLENKIINSGEVLNTLIISAPGGGKTTLLRDISRMLGSIENMRVSVIDSRFEIGAQYKGRAQLDIGKRSFLLSGYTKEDGFSHAIRSLSSKVIISDEIAKEDFPLIDYAANSGVGVILTAHGKSIEDIKRKFDVSLFSRFVVIENSARNISVFNKEGEIL